MVRLLAASTLALLTIPVLSNPADAQTVNLAPSTVARGGTVNLSGDGCFTNATPPLNFTVTGPSFFLGAGITSVDWSGVTGAWTATLVVPPSATPGNYTLAVQCRRQFAYPMRTFTVTGTTPTTPPTTVPPTTPPTTTNGTVPPPADNANFCDTLARARALLVRDDPSRAVTQVLAMIDQIRAANGCPS